MHRYFHRSVQHHAAVLGITETEAMDHLERNHRAILANKDGNIEVKLCVRSVDEEFETFRDLGLARTRHDYNIVCATLDGVQPTGSDFQMSGVAWSTYWE